MLEEIRQRILVQRGVAAPKAARPATGEAEKQTAPDKPAAQQKPPPGGRPIARASKPPAGKVKAAR